MPMTLGKLLESFPVRTQGAWRRLQVGGIAVDSRQVKPGDLFCALPGAKADGRDHIHAAIDKGAVAVLMEGALRKDWHHTQPQLAMSELRARLGRLADLFWDRPSADLNLIAITGTNGKTSTACHVAAALQQLEPACGLMGTLGTGLVEQVMSRPASAGLTTPAPTDLQAGLHRLRAAGARAVVLEASSHGLAQERLAGTRVDIAVLTNVTRDHLDYHEDFSAYLAAKQKLFSEFPLKGAVLNSDDPAWEAFRDRLPARLHYLTYSPSGQAADLSCEKLRYLADGLSLRFSLPTGHISLQTPLFGDFAAANLIAATAVLHLLGHSTRSIRDALASIALVPGRMEKLSGARGSGVFLDYAHTPDALGRALKSLRRHTGGRLWCVFGCGGDRDRLKRPMMGRLASELADQVVLTDDNPRDEDGADIICDIREGMSGPAGVQVERDRYGAIRLALTLADEGDAILIAGKGHETYQEVRGERLDFSDREVVAECLGTPA